MEKEILTLLKEKQMISAGDVVGVAVSGGADSMCLLHFLNEHKEDLDIEVVAVTVDHMIRGEASSSDATFVRTWCKENGILCWKFSVDALRFSQEKNVGIEEAAREVRYGVFKRLLEENKVDKIALAHHMGDQAETILLHILRGAGLNGAGGMEYVRKDGFIRPLLDTSKDDIIRYCGLNGVEYVDDETNQDSAYSRNFLRNQILPELKKRWEGVEQNLVNFGKSCREDNEFILSQTKHDGVIFFDNVVKIPLLYFHYSPSVVSRIIFDALSKINITKDICRKHILAIKDLAFAPTGKKINLPNSTIAQKEYEYLTIFKDENKIVFDEYDFMVGTFEFGSLYQIRTKRTKEFGFDGQSLFVDASKLPKGCVWRTKKEGDVFTKFGGGTKSLKSFLVDKKVPARIRQNLPVLALGNEIFCVLGVEISDKVKIDQTTKVAYQISFKNVERKSNPKRQKNGV